MQSITTGSKKKNLEKNTRKKETTKIYNANIIYKRAALSMNELMTILHSAAQETLSSSITLHVYFMANSLALVFQMFHEFIDKIKQYDIIHAYTGIAALMLPLFR